MIHSGYIGTLHAFEEDSSFSSMNIDNEAKDNEFSKLNSLLKESEFAAPRKNTLGPDMNILTPLKVKKPENSEINEEK